MWSIRHSLGMKSKVHPKYKTKYRVNNWAEHDRALVQRGDITLWISDDAVTSWKPARTGRRGAQRKFSDRAIETALTLRLVFNLPLRQAEGFLRSVLSLMALDLEAPDHTTLSRRSQHLNCQLARVSTKNPIHPLAFPRRIPSISSSTAQGCPSLAKESGPPPSMGAAADVAGRSFISVLIDLV
jgi:hypothetical protein